MKKYLLNLVWVTLLLISSINCYSQSNCLVANYPLNGNANEIIKSKNGVLYRTNTTMDRFGREKFAIKFNGENDCVSLGIDADYSTRTISLWFKADTFPTEGKFSLIFSSDNANFKNGGVGLAIDNNGENNRISIGIGTNVLRYSGASINKWYHCVVLRNYSNGVYYVKVTSPKAFEIRKIIKEKI